MSDVPTSPPDDRVADPFGAASRVRAMLLVEAALARAEARAEVIPAPAARAIAAACEAEAASVTESAAAALFAEGKAAGTPMIPLGRGLTAAVADDARAFVHLGVTSQDVMDTANMLLARQAIGLIASDLVAGGAACADLAERHARTPMAGRTLLQQASPITFGLKAARWLGMLTRRLERLLEVRAILPVQLGGPTGTLAALGDRGLDVMVGLAEELDLAFPDQPWHAERDVVADLAGALVATAGAAAKVGRDVILLAQSEVAEAAEAAPGGSSAMPHKRNPVNASATVAAYRLAVGSASVVLGSLDHEHERAAGAWQAEWEALPDLFRHAADAVAALRATLVGLRIDERRMRENLDLAGGAAMSEALVAALTPHLGRPGAFEAVHAASRAAAEGGLGLAAAAAEDDRIREALTVGGISAALDPAAFLGSAPRFITRAVSRFREVAAATER